MGTIKIQVGDHTVEVDDSFNGMSEDEQHKVVDEIAAGLPKKAAAQPEQEGPEIGSNVAAGAEAALLRSGVGVPKVALNAAKNYFTAPPAPTAAPSDLPGDVRWRNSADAINNQARIVTQNTELRHKFPNFQRAVKETVPTLKEKVIGGLDRGLSHPAGKAFAGGYNAMDAAEHVGTGPLGNVQALGSTVAAAAPYVEKYLPKPLKKYAKAASIVTPVVNYGIDTLKNQLAQPVPVEQKATGGLAGLAKGSSVIKKGVELAKEALPRLPRAPAKSKQEIEAIAQRMAPQQLGQFVQKPGETTSVAGKSRKQFDREQGLMHDIVETPHQLSDLPDIDYNKRLGAVATGLPGDKSGVATIHGFAGNKLEAPSIQEGGAPYGLHYQATNPNAPSELWASTGDAARRYMNFGKQVAHQYGTEDIIPHYMSMPQGMGYAQHFADVNLKGLRPAGADLGKLTDIIRGGSFKGKTFQDFGGFDNMDDVYEQMKHNPELRQFFNDRLQKQAVAKAIGLPPTYGTDALHAVTMPSLRDVETGAGGNVIGKLDLRREMTPTAHNTYTPGRDPGLNIPGEATNSSKYLMPYDLMYADSLQAVRNNPDQAAQEFGSLKMTGPRQVIDQQFIDEVEQYKEAMKKLTGMANGGGVQEYSDGKSVTPDVSLDTRSIPSMNGTPGVGYMQTPQGTMARLQLQKEIEDAKIRAGVSGMAMAIPGQQGIRTMPGQMDIGANVPVGPGNLDISANRSINPIPGRGHMQGVNARYTIPFAEGGEVPHYGIGGEILKTAAKKIILPAAENAARTQIIGTLPTYAKAAEALAQHGATGRAIDFGAGLGEGAKALGQNVDTYEPFAKNWNPTFTKPEDIPTDAYNRLTNLNVLNVVPREARDEIAQHIGRVMEPGGLGLVTTRGADVMKAQGQLGPEPMSMITSRDTYQKGFTKQELEDYMRYMLGNKFDVNKYNLGPAGVMIKKK